MAKKTDKYPEEEKPLLMKIIEFPIKLLTWIFKGLINIIVFLLELSSEHTAWNQQLQQEGEPVGVLAKRRMELKTILALIAVVINADGRVDYEQKSLIRMRMEKEFPRSQIDKWMKVLEDYTQKEFRIDRICKRIEMRFTLPEKIQLMNILCSVACRDTMLTNSEFETLREIGMRIKLPYKTLLSILELNNYITEEEAKQKKRNREQKEEATEWSLNKAYTILELDSDASVKEIKKAYRKLAMLHHPDRLIGMGEEAIESAKRKFQKIQDAYELIKNAKKFS